MMSNACETRRKFNDAVHQYRKATRPLWHAAQEGAASSRAQEAELQAQIEQVTSCLQYPHLRPSTVRVLRKELRHLAGLLELCSREVQLWEEIISFITAGVPDEDRLLPQLFGWVETRDEWGNMVLA
ncbi:hypothetical protein [Deinococcus roseus]|uniref:Uncharacterized protein n=1 Tax=Deinococcus roseus TaxID=392414 RepID=A0ABQ2CVI2_9DEIO|nr:hypothetical protein [Deinococcus roseus]GGJ23534.1 hypothetical protein GCM10008938_07130 [Deinococcus roseus]